MPAPDPTAQTPDAAPAGRASPSDRFEFAPIETLTDGVVDLVLEEREPADPVKGHVPSYHFRISRHDDPTKIGGIRLRVGDVRSTPSLLTSGHIGYEVDPSAQGHGYAARACRLVRVVARAHDMDRLIITCDPENVASRRTCERIGARLLGRYVVPPDHPMFRDGRREVLRYEWELARDR